MNELFKNDIAIRIISVLCAVLLWMYVSSAENPIDSKTVQNIKVKKVNANSLLEKGLVVKDDSSIYVSVTIEGKTRDINSVRESDFDAEIDYSQITRPGAVKIPFDMPKYSGESNIDLKTYSPKFITLTVEKFNQNIFPVELVIKGEPKNGYVIYNTVIKPSTVVLSEAQSLIETVDSVKIFVDINGIDSNKSYRKDCRVYNKKGEEIPELEQKLSQVDVDVFVAREIPVEVTASGSPASGYYISRVAALPEKVWITGSKDQVSAMNKLVLNPVNAGGASASINFEPEIKLPSGISIVNPTQPIKVEVEIKPAEKAKFTLSNIVLSGMKDKYSYELLTRDIAITAEGSSSSLLVLNTGLVEVTADVSQLEEGQHKAPVSFKLPDNVRAVEQENFVEVKVSKKVE